MILFAFDSRKGVRGIVGEKDVGGSGLGLFCSMMGGRPMVRNDNRMGHSDRRTVTNEIETIGLVVIFMRDSEIRENDDSRDSRSDDRGDA